MMKKEPIGSHEKFADAYSKDVDNRPIHVFYERPATWSLLPKSLSGLNVLDLGCGSGWYAEQFTKAGAKVTAVDVSEHMVKVTQQRLGASGQVFQADLENNLSFLADQSFDLIVAPLVIHYIKDWQKLMKEMARLLKPKGQFIFSTNQPHMAFQLYHLKNYFEPQIIEDYWPWANATVKYYHHTLNDLSESLSQAGFVIEKIIEPQPQEGLKQDPNLYALITTKPWFLFVKATKQ